MFPKKPYGIELDDALGNAIDASLLGMPAKDDWILFAAYDDKTLMRDALSYHLGRQQGRYASRARYCELVINGEYQGVYVLLEKIKRGKDRVDIAKLTTTDISGDNLTGGYILKIDKTTGSGGDGWTSGYAPPNAGGGQFIYFMYDYPKDIDITTEQKIYIQQYVNAFESTLAGNNFKDPVNGYAKYIDVNSFIDFYLMMEITKNADGYRLSTFFFKDKDSKGGKLTMGPIWDFNEGFGNVDYCTQGNPEGFVTDYNQLCNQDYWLIPFWWQRLFQDINFNNKTALRWKELRNGPFKTETIHNYIDSVANLLSVDSAQQRNFIQWPILGTYVWPNYYVGATYKDEISWLKNWVTQRTAWLDDHIKIITAIEPNGNPNNVVAFPNPFDRTISIQYELAKTSDVNFEILDVMGRSMENSSFKNVEPGKHVTEYNLSAPAGYYILKTKIGDDITYTKLIKR